MNAACQFQVKVQMRVGIAHQKKELGRIGPDLIDDFPHRDKLTGPLRHFHFFPAAQQIHHLDQHDLEAIFWIPIGLHTACMRGI
jgi:hypothetical protein